MALLAGTFQLLTHLVRERTAPKHCTQLGWYAGQRNKLRFSVNTAQMNWEKHFCINILDSTTNSFKFLGYHHPLEILLWQCFFQCFKTSQKATICPSTSQVRFPLTMHYIFLILSMLLKRTKWDIFTSNFERTERGIVVGEDFKAGWQCH